MSDKTQAMKTPIAFVERASLGGLALPERGFHLDPGARVYAALREHVTFAPRGPLEEDPSRKQLIPYIVVGDAGRVFVTRRKRAQTEARLHDKMSLGVGGHLELEDLTRHDDPILAGAARELLEELDIPSRWASRLVYRGVINDDTSEVGAVHLGLVYSLRAPEPEAVSILERDKMTGDWMPLEDVRAHADALESWSALLLDELPGFFSME